MIGTSAGGVQALSRIFKDLPSDFPGAILIDLLVRRTGSMEKRVLETGLASSVRLMRPGSDLPCQPIPLRGTSRRVVRTPCPVPSGG